MLFGGVAAVFCSIFFATNGAVLTVSPAFAPGHDHFASVLNIMALAPWAFVGFESVSHSAEEFRFPVKKSLPILMAALVAGALIYIFLAFIAVSVLPRGYASWPAYIGDLQNISGPAGLPTFNAVQVLTGRPGMIILGLAVIAGVVTGLVGNCIAASRLIYAMARDSLLPQWFAKLSGRHTPANAVLFIMLISLPIPFFGRTAIGWIVDVNTVGATIAYAYASAAAYRTAQHERNRTISVTGALGTVISVLFFLYFMVPNFWTVSALSPESYLILILWSILGFVIFRHIFTKDQSRRFGRSTVVWIVLLFLIFFTSMLWYREAALYATDAAIDQVDLFYREELAKNGIVMDREEELSAKAFTDGRTEAVNSTLTTDSLLQMAIIALALGIMFNLYHSIKRRETEMEIQKLEAEQESLAKSTFLSNMSHDIRTPMNAIIGYTALVKKEDGLSERVTDYLGKIEASSEHLLALINDVLEMSRIESGKMELEPAPADLTMILREVKDLFAMQMETKGVNYTVTCDAPENRMVVCDAHRLNRVLLNLISNALKFTPEGGTVCVSLKQTGATEEKGFYTICVKDTGMGMSPEFAARVFEAYERDRRASNIQGTGLGMAITKSIVDLMGGTISVKTEEGRGTEFVLELSFPLADEAEAGEQAPAAAKALPGDHSAVRLLLVEDNEINREVAGLFLEEAGFPYEEAENGQIAVELVREKGPGYYQCILMDVQMPVMNGYEATAAIRALPDPELAGIPIIAMTANAFAEDIQAAREAGMDAHIAKPIDEAKLNATLAEVLMK